MNPPEEGAKGRHRSRQPDPSHPCRGIAGCAAGGDGHLHPGRYGPAGSPSRSEDPGVEPLRPTKVKER